MFWVKSKNIAFTSSIFLMLSGTKVSKIWHSEKSTLDYWRFTVPKFVQMEKKKELRFLVTP